MQGAFHSFMPTVKQLIPARNIKLRLENMRGCARELRPVSPEARGKPGKARRAERRRFDTCRTLYRRLYYICLELHQKIIRAGSPVNF